MHPQDEGEPVKVKEVPIESERWWQRGPSFHWTFDSPTIVTRFLIRGRYTPDDVVMSIKVAGIEHAMTRFPVVILEGNVALPALRIGESLVIKTWGQFRAELSPVGFHYITKKP